MNNKNIFVFSLIVGIFLIGFAGATSVGVSDSDFSEGKVVYTAPPTPINYSAVNTNNSIYWNGNLWSDVRWLDIDGGNANQNIDVGSYNISASYFIGDGSGLTGVGDASYQFGANNFNGSGGFTTTGNITADKFDNGI